MTTRRIVVGIDDSGPGRQALCWAMDEAALVGCELDVVHAYQLPIVVVPVPMTSPSTTGPDIKARAEALVRRLTAEALARAGLRPPSVQQIAVEGQPGRALVECAGPGDVLVVGSRGRGGVVSATLGSCSHYCVHHVWCPIVVVPGGVGDPPTRRSA